MLWLLFACSIKKDCEMLDRIPHYVSHRVQSLYIYKGRLARAYLCCGNHEKAEPILALFRNSNYRFPDINSFLLDGLYLGGYYKECIQTFRTIQSLNLQRLQSNEAPVKIQYTAYSAVLRSFCKEQQTEGVSSIRSEMMRDDIHLREADFFALCELYDTLPNWKNVVSKVQSVCASKGVSLTKEQ